MGDYQGKGRYVGYDALSPITVGSHFMCEDCGALVLDRKVHDRSHSIQSSHAWSLAVLKTAHVAAHIHDRYEVVERIDSRQFDNWSADALAEVMAEWPDEDDQ